MTDQPVTERDFLVPRDYPHGACGGHTVPAGGGTPGRQRIGSQMMARPTFPLCGGKGVRIIYALPDLKVAEAAERGEVDLSGCVVGDDDPNLRCRACGHEWSAQPVHCTHR